ncbi:12990_t:CDS:2 [Funneliformis geosporum]|nr:12990_t:CDS:2 [Funneliformis geosporum]
MSETKLPETPKILKVKRVSKRVIVLPFSTKIEKVYYPIELLIKTGKIMCDQVKSIDKQRLGDKLGELDEKTRLKIDEVLQKFLENQNLEAGRIRNIAAPTAQPQRAGKRDELALAANAIFARIDDIDDEIDAQQVITDALALPQGAEDERNARFTELTRIKGLYPTGNVHQQAKNLNGAQAAALYNGKDGIQVLGSELSKGSGVKVKYNGNGLEYEANKTDDIIAAKKKKLADDAAERERQRKEALKTAKSTAISTLQILLDDTSNNQSKLTDEEAYIEAANDTNEARQKAIQAVKKNEFDNLNDQTAITNKQTELTGKIDTEKAKEPKQPEQKPLTEEESMEINQEQIINFITENVKGGQEQVFAKYLEEKLGQKPTGKNEIEKVNNFLTSEKAEKVIKVIFSFKVENDASFRNQTETEMNNWKEMDGKVEKVLDETVYQKKDGKFTPEAMARFLYEEKTGTPHQFAKKEQKTGDTPTETSH